MRSRGGFAASGVVLAVACAHPVAPGRPAAPGTASVPVSPPAPRPVAPAAAPTEPGETSPFARVTGLEATLHVFAKRVWLQPSEDGLAVLALNGDHLVRDEDALRGAARCDGPAGSMVETQPDDLWLVEDLSPWSACPPPHATLRRYRSGAWTAQGEVRVHWLSLGPWSGGATLIAEVPMRRGPPWGYTLRVVGPGRAPVPRRAPPGSEPGCYTEVDWPIALLSSAEGEALVIGSHLCHRVAEPEGPSDEEPEALDPAVAERFRPGKPSVIERLPVALDSDATIVGTGPRNVWVLGKDAGGRTALVVGHGDGFSIAEYPSTELSLLRATADGALYALGAGALLRRDPAGTWTRIPLPADVGTVQDVQAVTPEDLWLVADSGVYRTVPMVPYDAKPRECTEAERARLEPEPAPPRSAGPRAGGGKSVPHPVLPRPGSPGCADDGERERRGPLGRDPWDPWR